MVGSRCSLAVAALLAAAALSSALPLPPEPMRIDIPDSAWLSSLLDEAAQNADATRRTVSMLLGKDELAVDWAVDWGLLEAGQSRREGEFEYGSTPGQSQPPARMTQLLQCLRDKYEEGSGVNWEAATATDGRSLNLGVVGAWWSHATEAPSLPVTVVTAGSLDRLRQLRAQCSSWPGPLSAVLFQGLLQDVGGPLSQDSMEVLRKAALQVSNLVAELQRIPGSCQLSLLLTYEVYTEADALPLYPVNLLRNYARLQARTPLMVMLDVDLLLSRSLHNRLAREANTTSRLFAEVLSEKTVCILPAFEMTSQFDTVAWADAITAAPSKVTVRVCLHSHILIPFYWTRWKTGHMLTDFERWQNARSDYIVEYQQDCEPYLLGARKSMPWYDSRYRGFGRNKIQHVRNLAADGYKFKVLHDSYIVHRPHENTAAQLLHKTHARPHAGGISMKQFVEKLYTDQAAAKQWTATVGSAVQHCMDTLPWWQGPR